MRPRQLMIAVGTIVLILIPIISPPASAQVGEITVGIALSKLIDQLNQAILNARNAGLSVEIEAGREVNIAIANAQNAYQESLNKTLKEVDPKIKGTIDQLQSLVNNVTNRTFQKLDDVTAQAQQIVNSLPFRKHEPQLTKVLPRFIVPATQPYPVLIHFRGDFEFAAKEDFTPMLQIKGHRYMPSENDTQNLKFSVPVSDIFPVSAAPEPKVFDYTIAALTVPWQTSAWLGIVKKRHEDHYQVVLGALPPTPGKLVLVHTTSHKEPRTKVFTSGAFHQASTREAGNNDDINHPYAVTPESGWHVIRNTSKFNVTTAQGDWSYGFVGDDGDRVVYNVTTIHHGAFGSSGSVDFYISFTQIQEVDVPDTVTEPIVLKWGDSRSFNYPAGSWKLIFDAFDGSHAEFTGADENNRFIKMQNQQGSMIISTADPKSLSWP